jgi:hypothetical protein
VPVAAVQAVQAVQAVGRNDSGSARAGDGKRNEKGSGNGNGGRSRNAAPTRQPGSWFTSKK